MSICTGTKKSVSFLFYRVARPMIDRFRPAQTVVGASHRSPSIWSRNSVLEQFFQVRFDRLRQPFAVISALQATDEPALGVGVGGGADDLCHLGEVLDFKAERTDRILGVSV